MLNIKTFTQTGMIVILVIFCTKIHIWSSVVHLKLLMFVDIKLQVIVIAPCGHSLGSRQVWRDKDVNCNLMLCIEPYNCQAVILVWNWCWLKLHALITPHSNEVETIPIRHRLVQVGTACLTKMFSLILSRQNKTEFLPVVSDDLSQVIFYASVSELLKKQTRKWLSTRNFGIL